MLGGLGTKAWQYGRNAALGAAEYMTPVLTESQFAEKGVLTPEEFVKAGDMLVLRCPTWQWQAGDPANARPFLPPDKQYLFTRNVPCQRRAASLMSGADDEHEVDGGEASEGWLSAHASHVAKAAHDEEVPDMVDATSAIPATASKMTIAACMPRTRCRFRHGPNSSGHNATIATHTRPQISGRLDQAVSSLALACCLSASSLSDLARSTTNAPA